MLRPLAIALALVAALPAAAQSPVEFEGRLGVGPAWDSNVGRQSGEAPIRDDLALALLAGVDLRWRPATDQQTTLTWTGGGRLFRTHDSENQLAHALSVGHGIHLGGAFSASMDLRRQDRWLESRLRDAADTSGALRLQWAALPGLTPEVRVGWRHFDWWPDPDWSGGGPTTGLGLRWQPMRRHVADLGWEMQLRQLPGRHERMHAGHLGWTWRGPVVLSAGYLLGHAQSDVRGYASVRHRMRVLVGARLPFGLLLSAQGVLQLVRFPEGFRIAPDLVTEDEESLSSVAAKLALPVGSGLSLEARYQLHLATFLEEELTYERHLVSSGVTWRF